jgi:phytoene synthase
VVVPRGVDRAYDYCLGLARAHYENFPVASWLLPAHMRPHVAAVYAFARIADDYADESSDTEAVRLSRLDAWRTRLHATAAGSSDPGGPHPDVFVALRHSMLTCAIPVTLLDDLLSAFAQDVTTRRYDTWNDVLDYCRRSANPVGRLVLRIAGRATPELDTASDAVCTALQLANFWQDFAIDWSRGRLYVPAETWRAHGARIESLDPAALDQAWRAGLRECCARTRELFHRGRAVSDGVTGRLRYELRFTWLGGMRVLRKVEAANFDVARHRPALGAADALPIAWDALRWPAALASR